MIEDTADLELEDDLEAEPNVDEILASLDTPEDISESDWDRSFLSAQSLMRRIDVMDELVTSEAISPHLITKKWIAMLREANTLHNEGTITTEDFKRVNTRLVNFFEASEGAPRKPSPAQPSGKT